MPHCVVPSQARAGVDPATPPRRPFFRVLRGGVAGLLMLLSTTGMTGSMAALLAGCQQAMPPQQEEVILEEAKANIEKGNLKTALNQLSKVLVENPRNTDVMVNLAWIY
ncbi:MAG: hypothetical protein KC462_09920, partial [Cyanobacteria bacterium HKST-UBA05]|nr:hypothetical protein [Cyanobacteria bacterium HKST-UBA05]